MKDAWLESVAKLMSSTDFPLGEPPVDSDFPSISLPIDVQADQLLARYVKEPPQWNALEVESLVNLLANRVASCISLRDRAQDLEVEATEALLSFSRTSALLELEATEIKLRESWEPKLAQNKIEGSSDVEYWSQVAALASERVRLAKEVLLRRRDKSTSEGNASNYVERFSNLKRAFDSRLLECYRIARSVSAGLKTVYGLDADVPLPIEVGYLSVLSLWTGDVVEKLDRLLSFRSETTVAVVIGSYLADATENPILPSTTFVAGVGAGVLTFELDQAALNKAVDDPKEMQNLRLRGLRPFLTRNKGVADAWQIRIDLPRETVGGHSVARILQTTSPNTEIVSLAEIPWSSAVHNVSPLGSWEVRVAKWGLLHRSAWSDANTRTLGLELRLAYDLSA